MARTGRAKPKKTVPVLAAMLAWLVPGAGHWYLGRPARAAVFFVTIHALFWSGVAIGGVFTVNPREEAWWCRAQMCTGVGGLLSYGRQESKYRLYRGKAIKADSSLDAPTTGALAQRQKQKLTMAISEMLAKDKLALVAPTSSPAYILSGVAGMLNLLCIFDAFMLSLMGRYGEPAPPSRRGREETK